MKRKLLLFTAVAGFGYITLSSYAGGPANAGQGNRAIPGANNTCSGGSCHGGNVTDGTTNININDGVTGLPVTDGKYIPSRNYTIILSGSRVGAGKYGYQLTALTATNTEGGTLSVPGSSTTSQVVDPGVKVAEHKVALTTMGAQINWTAPDAGAGSITFATIINATNGNGSADANDHAFTSSITLAEGLPASVGELSSKIQIAAFPNPAKGAFSLKFDEAEAGTYSVSIYDLAGKRMHSESMNIQHTATMNVQATNWATGMYMAHITKDGAQRILPVVIQ